MTTEPATDTWPSTRSWSAIAWFDGVLVAGLIAVQPLLLGGLALCDGPGCAVAPRWLGFVGSWLAVGAAVTAGILGAEWLARRWTVVAIGLRVADAVLVGFILVTDGRALLTPDGDGLLALVATVWWLVPALLLARGPTSS